MSRQPDPPRYVVASAQQATVVLRRLADAGWSVRAGFALPAGGEPGDARVVLHGPVTDQEQAQAVVLAAARGAAVVAVADVAGPVGRALVADLGRLGPLGAVPPPDQGADPLAELVPEQRALLDRLAAGETIAAAAAAEFLSLRTANRRIAQARALFGVGTTREAVSVYLRWLRGQ